MIRLAIDLGTKLGWALDVHGVRSGGTKLLVSEADRKLAVDDSLDRRCDPRFGALLDHIMDIRGNHGGPDLIIFEDVKFSVYTQQTQLWSSLRAAIWAYKWLRPNTNIQCLDTSKLKKWGTNNGAATKEMMGAWLVRKHPNLYIKNPEPIETCFVRERYTDRMVDDNQVDAQHLLDYAIANF
jgi:hypothetical protein